MRDFEFDLFVIGGGSGGVRAARLAAQRGAMVALAEAGALGGTCVNAGCVPKKLYGYAAHYAEAFEEAPGFGWSLHQAPTFDWATLQRNRAAEIARLNGIYADLLRRAGVTVLAGQAALVDAHTVRIDGRTHRARHILVATGGRPRLPDFPGCEQVVTSDQVFGLPRFPSRLLVIGGGYIACEFASIFQGLGSRVTQVHRGGAVLAGFDQDVRAFIAAEMRTAGVDLRLACSVRDIVPQQDGLRVRLADGSSLLVDAVLAATGRKPNTQGLGLEAAGVAVGDDGAIRVDEAHRTSVPSIHAVGDVCSRIQLTPVKHTLSGRATRTLVKLVVETAGHRVVGLHMVGEEAGEIVQGFAVALRAGATKAVFDQTLGIHPTVAEEFVSLREPVAAS
jgi:glutathione reductase (NADPH)